jgi:hypothetical protein
MYTDTSLTRTVRRSRPNLRSGGRSSQYFAARLGMVVALLLTLTGVSSASAATGDAPNPPVIALNSYGCLPQGGTVTVSGTVTNPDEGAGAYDHVVQLWTPAVPPAEVGTKVAEVKSDGPLADGASMSYSFTVSSPAAYEVIVNSADGVGSSSVKTPVVDCATTPPPPVTPPTSTPPTTKVAHPAGHFLSLHRPVRAYLNNHRSTVAVSYRTLIYRHGHLVRTRTTRVGAHHAVTIRFPHVYRGAWLVLRANGHVLDTGKVLRRL